MSVESDTPYAELILEIAADSKLLPRFFASVIDKILACGVGLVFYGLAGSIWPRQGRAEYASLLIALGCYILYFVLCEAVTGRTVGKFLNGLVVVSRDGHRCSTFEALVRNVFRAFEDIPIPIGMFICGLTIFLTSYRQRIGDLVAGTFVIDILDADRIARRAMRVDLSGE